MPCHITKLNKIKEYQLHSIQYELFTTSQKNFSLPNRSSLVPSSLGTLNGIHANAKTTQRTILMGVSKVTGAWKYTVNTSQNPWEETLLAGVIFLACQTADVKRLLQYQISSTICAITPFCFKIRKKSNLGQSQYQIKDLFLNNFSTCRVKEKFSRNTFQYKIVYYVLFSPYLEHCEIHTIREYMAWIFTTVSFAAFFSGVLDSFVSVLCIESSQRNEEEIELVL